MELHPAFQQPELYDFCKENGIEIIGFCPIGSPARPERDKTPDDVVDTQLPEVQAVAKAHGIHPATVCLKWAVQRGHMPIPFSTTRKNYLSNLRCTFEDPLTDEEMELLKKADKNCRLIKGQVFLWEGPTPGRICGILTEPFLDGTDTRRNNNGENKKYLSFASDCIHLGCSICGTERRNGFCGRLLHSTQSAALSADWC